jgi:hypothetical protein
VGSPRFVLSRGWTGHEAASGRVCASPRGRGRSCRAGSAAAAETSSCSSLAELRPTSAPMPPAARTEPTRSRTCKSDRNCALVAGGMLSAALAVGRDGVSSRRRPCASSVRARRVPGSSDAARSVRPGATSARSLLRLAPGVAPAFDTYVAIDWSASSVPTTGADSVWWALAEWESGAPHHRERQLPDARGAHEMAARRARREAPRSPHARRLRLPARLPARLRRRPRTSGARLRRVAVHLAAHRRRGARRSRQREQPPRRRRRAERGRLRRLRPVLRTSAARSRRRGASPFAPAPRPLRVPAPDAVRASARRAPARG